MKNVCALCQNEAELRESHLIPKFIFDYIKRTSATGYMRNVTSINRRLQDGPKMKLLCEECEQRFSRSEKYFAEEIFSPYATARPSSIIYNENFRYFVASLAFRSMLANDSFKHKELEYSVQFDTAKENLRQYLLDSSLGTSYKFHVLPVHHEISEMPNDMNEKIVWYFARSADSDIICSESYALVYIKIPYFLFFMPFSEGIGLRFLNTEIFLEGILNLFAPTDYMIPDGFFGYLNRRVEAIFANQLSQNQQDKLSSFATKNPDSIGKSESLKVKQSEERLKGSKLKK